MELFARDPLSSMSKYGLSNIREAFAEGFVVRSLAPTSIREGSYSDYLNRFLDLMNKSELYDDYELLDDLSDDLYGAAYSELADEMENIGIGEDVFYSWDEDWSKYE